MELNTGTDLETDTDSGSGSDSDTDTGSDDHDTRPDERWYDQVAAELRGKFQPGDDGAVWVLFADEQRVVQMAMAITPDGSELGPLEYDSLARVIGEVDAPAVLIAIPRADGIPVARDWRLWEEMRGRLEALTRSELIDLVVVGAESWWAVVGGRPDHAA